MRETARAVGAQDVIAAHASPEFAPQSSLREGAPQGCSGVAPKASGASVSPRSGDSMPMAAMSSIAAMVEPPISSVVHASPLPTSVNWRRSRPVSSATTRRRSDMISLLNPLGMTSQSCRRNPDFFYAGQNLAIPDGRTVGRSNQGCQGFPDGGYEPTSATRFRRPHARITEPSGDCLTPCAPRQRSRCTRHCVVGPCSAAPVVAIRAKTITGSPRESSAPCQA